MITVAEQHRREGPNLWERDPDRCCDIRKVEPLVRALEPYDAWASGIRRDQSPSRADTPKVEWSERYGVWKLHPLADWDEKRVWAYIHVNEIPFNPLHETGYRSIGCIPCTRPTTPGRRGARRPLGRLRQARVRHPRDQRKGTHDATTSTPTSTPSRIACASGGFTLWFTGLSGLGQVDDRPRRSGPSSTAAA